MDSVNILWNVNVILDGLACFAMNLIVMNVSMVIVLHLEFVLAIRDGKDHTVSNAKIIQIVSMAGVSINPLNANASMDIKDIFVTFQPAVSNVTLNM